MNPDAKQKCILVHNPFADSTKIGVNHSQIGPNEPKSGSKLTFKLWRMNSEITRLILFPFILYTPDIDLKILKSSLSRF